MKKSLIIIIALLFSFCAPAYAQTTEPPKDEPTVVIKQSTANECATCFQVRLAQADELKILKEMTVPALEKEIYRLREEMALKTGELIGCKQTNLEFREMIQFLQKNGRKKGFIVF